MRKVEGFPRRVIIGFLFVLLLVGGAGILALLQSSSALNLREADAKSAVQVLIIGERL